MIPGQFDYVRPGSLDETLRILKDREGEAKLLSGGYSLIPLIKLRLAQPRPPRRPARRDRSRRDRRDRRRAADRRPGHAPADPRGSHHRRPLPAAPRRHRRHRRSAGPQLGDHRRLRRPCGPGVGLAGGAPRGNAAASSAASGTGERVDRRPRLLPRHLPDRDRADRGPDRGPVRPPSEADRRRVREARAQGRRLRHGRASAAASDSATTARSQTAGIGITGVADTPFAATDAEAAPGRGQRRTRSSSGRRAPPPARRADPSADVRGPVDYKRAMVAELTVRALRTAAERALAYA